MQVPAYVMQAVRAICRNPLATPQTSRIRLELHYHCPITNQAARIPHKQRK